jgi:hypothetical protein
MHSAERLSVGRSGDLSNDVPMGAHKRAAAPNQDSTPLASSRDTNGQEGTNGRAAMAQVQVQAWSLERVSGRLAKLESVGTKFMSEFCDHQRDLLSRLVSMCQDAQRREQQQTEALAKLKHESQCSLRQKDETVAELEARLQELSRENELLRRELDELRNENAKLRSHDREATLLLDAKTQNEQRARAELHAAQQSLQAVLETLQAKASDETAEADAPGETAEADVPSETVGLYCSKFLEDSRHRAPSEQNESIPWTPRETTDDSAIGNTRRCSTA